MNKDELKAKLDELAASIVTDRAALDRFAENWSKGFHPYSLGNLLLIWSQRPEASLCSGFNQWKRLRRWVKAGEKGIAILAPLLVKHKAEKPDDPDAEGYELRGFRVVYVFDYAQTDGEPLDLGRKAISGRTDVTLDGIMAAFPEFAWTLTDGARMANGATDGKTIEITRRPDALAMISTAFHELGHAVLGHAGQHNPPLSRTQKEAEAEAVSYLVGSVVGIKNEDAGKYIGQWNGDRAALVESGHRILKAAESILRRIVPDQFKSGFEPSADEAR